MFIGREQELRTLNQLYASGKFEFAVIYGRRRVGKTALISEFIKGSRTLPKASLQRCSCSSINTTQIPSCF